MAASDKVGKRKPARPKRKTATGKPRSGSAVASRRPAAEQPMMNALRAEHRHMATVMKLFADQLDSIEAGELVDTHVVYEIMDYMVSWPDRFHHPREDLIYARVAELDKKAVDEVDTLQRDHDHTAKTGRKMLGSIERWRLGEVTGPVLIKQGREYIDHIHKHMNLEEQLVFPRIEETLTLQDWRELAEDDQLRGVSESVFGPQVQREFRNMTRKLRRNLRRSVEHGTMVEWIGLEAFMESLEVMSIAYDSALEITTDHLSTAVDESLEFFREAPLTAPLRCIANNTRVTFRLLGEMAEISLETLDDLSRVNQVRKDRIRLMERDPRRN
jgi:hemerythrin-like domain-containing protein